MVLNQNEGRFRYKEKKIYSEGSETLQQVAKRWGRCPIPGNLQGQAEQVSEQADLAARVPAHGWGIDWLICVRVLYTGMFLLLWLKWFKMLLSRC